MPVPAGIDEPGGIRNEDASATRKKVFDLPAVGTNLQVIDWFDGPGASHFHNAIPKEIAVDQSIESFDRSAAVRSPRVDATETLEGRDSHGVATAPPLQIAEIGRIPVTDGATCPDLVEARALADLDEKSVTVDEAYVDRMLADIVGNEDLSRYVL